MKVAIVHDYLTQKGGAERVVLEMLRAFPEAELATTLYEPETTFPEFSRYEIRVSPLNRVAALRHDHRRALPLLPWAVRRIDVGDADVVLASSSGCAHAVAAKAPKVVYCYNPPRWIYQTDDYLGDAAPKPLRFAARSARGVFSKWDQVAARSARRYLTTSSVVAARIKATYGRTAEIVPPPPGLDQDGPRTPRPDLDPGFLLCVSRLLPYKHVDALVEAVASRPDVRLVVVGDGPERARLAQLGRPNVVFTGSVDDAQLRWLYANAGAVIAASHEDYGLTPLEGLEFGIPSIVLRAGGFLDTVVEGATGVFFDRPEAPLIQTAIDRWSETTWDQGVLAEQAERFGRVRFANRLREILEEVVNDERTTGQAATGRR